MNAHAETPILGLGCRHYGLSTIHGPLLARERQLDGLFLGWAERWGATEYRFPPFIAAHALDRVGYFQSFPHLATFPVTLEAEPDNLDAFSANPFKDTHALALQMLAPADHVVTPAACYHVYDELTGSALADTCYITTRGTCCRHEQHYAQLQRQWTFDMREIVCIGSETAVENFLTTAAKRLDGLIENLGLDAAWRAATDPFFRPLQNPKFFLQKLAPVKRELLFRNRLAIASVNRHRDHFGKAFAITLQGKPAHSACIAFGLERWLYALAQTFGADPGSWPDLEAHDD